MRRDLFDDQTAEAVLEGRIPPGHELGALAAFVADVRQSYGHGPAPHAGTALAGLLASGLTTDKGELPATAVSNAHGPATQVAGLPKWRRKRMVGSRFGTTAAKVAAACAAACAAVGGVAGAGALPAPAQSAVAHAADEVGIELPSPDHRAVPPDATGPPPTSVPAPPTAGAPPDDRGVAPVPPDAGHGDSEHGVPAVGDNEGDGEHQEGDVDDHDADDAEHQGTPPTTSVPEHPEGDTPTTSVPEHHKSDAPTTVTAPPAGHD